MSPGLPHPADPFDVTTARGLRAMAQSYWKVQPLLAAVELDLFTAIAHGATAAEAAKRADADERGTHRLLCALAALGLAHKDGETFRPTDTAARLLVRSSPEFLHGLAHSARTFKAWGTLADAVRHGGSVLSRGPGDRDAAWLDSFIAAMHHRTHAWAPDLAKAVTRPGDAWMLDVGGGSGGLAMACCRAAPGLSAVVVDLPEVAELARGYLAGEGMEGRVRVVGGDFLEDNLPTAPKSQGFDLALLSAIAHMLSPKQLAALLARIKAALRPGGRLALHDFVMDEGRTAPAYGALFALNMLVNTSGGDTYTESELRAQLSQAGFTHIQRMDGIGRGVLFLAAAP